MKVTLKIFILISIVTIVSLTGYGVFAFNRDLDHFIDDMENDARILSKVLYVEIRNLIMENKLNSLLESIRLARSSIPFLNFRWVWLEDNTDEEFAPVINYNTILNDSKRNLTDFVHYRYKNVLLSYMIIKTPYNRLYALEISEDLAKYIKTFSVNNILHLGVVGFLILLSELIIIWLMGYFLLTKRIDEILFSIKEIGNGNLALPFVVKGKDEIAVISKGLESMRVDLKNYQIQLVQSKNDKINLLQQLRHSDRLSLIGKISSGIAHEMGTPLNIISGRAKLLKLETITHEEIIENARIIYDQSERISEIIKEFLKFARRKKVRKEFIDLNQLLKNLINLITPEAKKQQVEIIFSEDETGTKIYLDEIQIGQVFSNILMNAIAAMTDGGNVEIKIDYKNMYRKDEEDSELKKYAEISFKDTGTGIPE
ncbi:MAG: hypothetical protein JXJ04_18515, partial [Spirochaetales bacterium]|nr:hypothetical protein [Spirochaetales bacterium]